MTVAAEREAMAQAFNGFEYSTADAVGLYAEPYAAWPQLKAGDHRLGNVTDEPRETIKVDGHYYRCDSVMLNDAGERISARYVPCWDGSRKTYDAVKALPLVWLIR